MKLNEKVCALLSYALDLIGGTTCIREVDAIRRSNGMLAMLSGATGYNHPHKAEPYEDDFR